MRQSLNMENQRETEVWLNGISRLISLTHLVFLCYFPLIWILIGLTEPETYL